MFESLFVCLGWIMEATCCLLIYDPELMFDVIDLNMHCFCYEIIHNPAHSYIWCVYSHLIGRLTYDPWSEASFEDIFICCLPCSISMISSFLWVFFVPGLCSMHGLWVRERIGGSALKFCRDTSPHSFPHLHTRDSWCISHWIWEQWSCQRPP